MFTFNTVEEAVVAIAQGKHIIVVDDEDRENEGDLVIASELVTPEAINFMVQYGSGLICTSITEERAIALDLAPMIFRNTAHYSTAFTVSIDAANGISTGASTFDRAHTIQLMTKKETGPIDFVRPGHVFPLVGKKNGVLERAGHTEASIDLVSAAGLFPSGVICEVMKNDGTMARLPDLMDLAHKFNLKIIHIKDLIAYKLKCLNKSTHIETAELPTTYGPFQVHVFDHATSPAIVLSLGTFSSEQPVLTRVHSECSTGELFGSLRCDCGDQLKTAMHMIQQAGAGLIIYLKQEGRGIGLLNKIKAYQLQDRGYDTVDANKELGFAPDLRDYTVAADILDYFSIKHINLLTNNPLKITALSMRGIIIENRIPILTERTGYNDQYLTTKKNRMGHLF